MNFRKRFLAGMLASAMCVGALAGCGSSSGGNSEGSASSSSTSGSGSSDVKIGYVNMADTDVFCMTREQGFVTAAEAKGWTVECTDGNNDSQKQVDQARTFITKGVDCLVIVPCDSEGITNAILEANKADIPVIIFGIKAADGDYVYVGSDDKEAGMMEGELMAEMLPENAKVCYLAGVSGVEASKLRREGLNEALEAAGRDDVEIVADQDGKWEKAEGMRITEAWIQKYGDGDGGVTFDAIISANDQMALGAIEALKAVNLLDGENNILINGVDGTSEAVDMVESGYMVQTVFQNGPGQGEAAVNTIEKILNGEDVDSEVIVPFESITIDNVADYK